MLQSLTIKKKVDRLSILIFGGGNFKLLGVSKFPLGTRESQANESIKDWGLLNQITSM